MDARQPLIVHLKMDSCSFEMNACLCILRKFFIEKRSAVPFSEQDLII